MTQKSIQCNEHDCNSGLMSKWWGPAWWSIIHTVVASGVPQKEYFVRCAAQVLPCAACRSNFQKQLGHTGAVSVQWLELAHAHASGRSPGQYTLAAPAVGQTVAFVAKCVAVNYPLELPSARANASHEFLEILYLTFPQQFRARVQRATARAGVQLSVENALKPEFANPPCSTLEQLRYYPGWDSRVERCAQNARAPAPVFAPG